MSILDKAVCIKRYPENYSIDDFCKTNIVIENLSEDDELTSASFGMVENYRMNLSLYYEFSANSAQFEAAKKQALICLNHLIYKDVINHIHHLRSAIFSGDRDKLFKILGELENGLKLVN